MADIGLDELATPGLRLHLMGQFEIFAGTSSTPLRLPVGKATTVTQVLAVRRGSFVPVDVLVDILWGDDPPPAAPQNVASLVSRIRRLLGGERITGGRSGYRFETAGCQVDVDEAERLVHEAEGQLRAGRHALAASASSRARQLLERGGFLEEEPYASWAEDGRRHAERLLRAARRASWAAALALDQPRTALDVATLAVESDPLDEEAHRARINALYAAGDAAAALQAYEELRTALVEGFGADPSPETEALYLAVLRSDPWPPVRVAAEDDAEPAPHHARDRIVGRDVELDRLVHCWADAAGGQPRAVVVSGAAGAGKTRLAAELASRARGTGGAVLWGHCHEGERSLFLQPLLEALRGHLDGVAPERARPLVGEWAGTLAELMPDLRPMLAVQSYERVTPELEHRRSFEAVAGVVQRLALEQPVLLILDDVHLAGESTLAAVHFLLDRLTQEPVLVVLTTASDATEEVLDVVGRHADFLSLGPLSLVAVEQLARSLGVADVNAVALHKRTGGNPQLVIEALRLAADDPTFEQPEWLQTAVVERVRRAGRDVEELLRVAAVVGVTFDLDLAADLAGVSVEDAAQRADHAFRAGVLTSVGSRFEFAGSLIRDALYETTPVPIRASRHRRAAAMLVDRPEAAARHHAAAGDWAPAHEAWSAATEQAVRAFALRDAEALLTHALAAAERAGDKAAVTRAHLRRGQLREELADYQGAQDDHTAALTLARELNDDALEARALERLGWTAYYGRDSAAASELATRAAELAESAAAAPAALPSALVLVGRIRHWAGDIDGAASAYEEALARNPDSATLASALSCLGALLEHGDRFMEARRTLDRAAAESTRSGAFRPLLRTLFFTGLARANLGDFGGALRALDRKRRLLDQYEVHFYRARTDTVLGWVWREIGELDRARDLAQQAVLEAREVRAGSLQVEQELHGLLGAAECALLDGDQSTASALIAEAEPLLSAWLPFHWRAELRFREVRCRLVPEEAEVLLELSRERRSRKYEALALAHLGRREEAAVAASATGSNLLLAEVAPLAQARAAFDQLAAGLPPELRHRFVTKGRLARVIAVRT